MPPAAAQTHRAASRSGGGLALTVCKTNTGSRTHLYSPMEKVGWRWGQRQQDKTGALHVPCPLRSNQQIQACVKLWQAVASGGKRSQVAAGFNRRPGRRSYVEFVVLIFFENDGVHLYCWDVGRFDAVELPLLVDWLEHLNHV